MPDPKPNILLITTDQQRFDSCGPAAPSFMRTPHYDHLRREGVEFTRAYVDCPICVASRVAIMTGKYDYNHGMPGNGKTSAVMGRTQTLPAYLREQGYQTAAIGKMHFGPQRARHGFDEMIIPDDYYRWMRAAGSPLQPMRHGLGQNELYPGMATVPESLTLTNWIADQCVQYVGERRDPTAPFFLWCSFAKPHPPLDPPEPYYSMYRNCPIPEPIRSDWCDDEHCPPAIRHWRRRQSYDLIPPEIIREARAAYYGLITQIDYNMGRVFAALQDLDLFNDTMIVYTSDHGEFLGDHRCGSKIFFHEPSAHVPMVVRAPKSWADRRPGSVCDATVTLADILPTVLTAAGAAPPKDADGLDLLALARGQTPRREYLECLAGIQKGIPMHLSITDGRWKYSYYPEGPCEQLFDIHADPQERHERSADATAADQLTRLREALLQRMRRRNSVYLQNGQLPVAPATADSEADLRNTSWPGYHTEHYPVDVRH